ncbi:MAG: queuosine precursor transporter, partial [Elusimicrobiaceae bacterium]|nr:queuosine precursor transporter [Elusimicrobiaceae bacterium]
MSLKKAKWLIFLSAISCWILLNSNLAAVKIWSFFGIPVDGGIVLFPLSYIFGDIIVEFYGKELANKVVGASFLTSLGTTIVFLIVDKLEPFPGWGLQEAYHSILGLAPRIMIGSILAYLISGLLNNYVFENMRK